MLRKLQQLKLKIGDLLFLKYQDSQIKIQDHFKLTRGKTPPTKNLEYYQNGTLPWLDGGSLNGAYFLTEEIKPSKLITEKAKIECQLPFLEPNSVIFSNINTGQKNISFVKTSQPITFSNHVWQLTASNNYQASCLFFSLRQVNFKLVSSGSVFSEVQTPLLLNLKINWVANPQIQKLFLTLLNGN